jgi:hypothetical protein
MAFTRGATFELFRPCSLPAALSLDPAAKADFKVTSDVDATT